MGATLTCSDPAVRHAITSRRLVMVADDSLTNQAIRIGFRKTRDFVLVGYADGSKTSANTILDVSPDVILLDDVAQSERALALLRAIREEDLGVAVFILGKELGRDWLDRVFRAGATGVISKATHPNILVTLVRETLDGHIVHRPAAETPPVGADVEIADPNLPLTAQKLEILQLVASGATNGDIACRLPGTTLTVKLRLRNIHRSLDVANRTQLSRRACVNGLVGAAQAPARAERHLTVA